MAKETDKNKRPIGILGGTFDPIHFGHLRCALELRQNLDLQEVRFIPCKQPVHKEKAYSTTEQRRKMVELALHEQLHEQWELILDTRELDRNTPSYMVETLESIRQQVGQQPLCLILGTDALVELASWHRWQELIELAHIIVIHRPGVQFEWRTPIAEVLQPCLIDNPKKLELQPAGCIVMQTTTLLNISATAIRQLIHEGKSPRYLLPESLTLNKRLY